MEFLPGDLLLARVLVPDPGFRTNIDKWKQSPYKVISKFDKLVFKVQEVGNKSNIHTLHRNILFSLMTVDQHAQEEATLVKANLLMYQYFDPL